VIIFEQADSSMIFQRPLLVGEGATIHHLLNCYSVRMSPEPWAITNTQLPMPTRRHRDCKQSRALAYYKKCIYTKVLYFRMT
jgi:hypothetical protein